MFYRRKIILALLETFDGTLEKVRLQKLLFLFTIKQPKADYDFIPFKYGCFSYSATADLSVMTKKGLLIDEYNGYSKSDKISYLKAIKEIDKRILLDIKNRYGTLNGTALMKHTYLRYPYFAINSVKAEELLTPDELDRVNLARPKSKETILFTVGYEGISLESYINKLIKNDVQLLIDVRKNPLSMKYGFSKSLLKRFCESVKIEYLHFPEVGIDSDQRKNLNNQKDYDQLFEKYRNNDLSQTHSTQVEILNLLVSKKRVALTCFEANVCQCHRKPLAESVAQLPGFVFQIKHI